MDGRVFALRLASRIPTVIFVMAALHYANDNCIGKARPVHQRIIIYLRGIIYT